ncbi:MAG TPA: hypothetical protein VGN07_15835 [Steroidobacteraceae bacterium]|jgi:hypothetical protein
MAILLKDLMVWVFYPLWLIAGGIDYVCHRRSRIDHTSGSSEAWLHVGQFLTLAVFLWLVACITVTKASLLFMGIALAAHTALAFVDVSYTIGRRYISPLEQMVHGFMDVLPLVAFALLVILNLSHPVPDDALQPAWHMVTTSKGILLFGSYLVLAGAPVLEELLRTRRAGTPNATPRKSLPQALPSTDSERFHAGHGRPLSPTGDKQR